MSADQIGANEIKGAGTTFGQPPAVGAIALGGGAFVAAAGTIVVNGTNVTLAGTEGSKGIADAINLVGSGVTAEAKLSMQITGITSTDDSIISIGPDTYDLGTFGGDMARLTEELVADGYNAVYDDTLNGGAGGIHLKATDVDGIEVQGGTAGSITFTDPDQTPTPVPAVYVAGSGIVMSSKVELSSAKTIGVSDGAGTNVAAFLNTSNSTLSTVESVDISGNTSEGAQRAVSIIDAALGQIDNARASLGAVQNRFSHTISNLANVAENVSASRSRIQDTDFAKETAVMTKNQILQQAGTTILSQANQIPQAAISLLGG
jgi:flagellin